MSGREHRRSVITEDPGHEIPVFVTVVRAREEGGEPPVGRVRENGARGGDTQVIETVRVGKESDSLRPHEVIVEFRVLISANDVDAVVASLTIEREQRLQGFRRVAELGLLGQPAAGY